jgi:hypothetical protein
MSLSWLTWYTAFDPPLTTTRLPGSNPDRGHPFCVHMSVHVCSDIWTIDMGPQCSLEKTYPYSTDATTTQTNSLCVTQSTLPSKLTPCHRCWAGTLYLPTTKTSPCPIFWELDKMQQFFRSKVTVFGAHPRCRLILRHCGGAQTTYPKRC